MEGGSSAHGKGGKGSGDLFGLKIFKRLRNLQFEWVKTA